MGVEIWSHGDNKLCTRKASWMVVHWAEHFCPTSYVGMTAGEISDTMGVIYVSAKAIEQADLGVPRDIDEARAAGFFEDEDGDDDDFERARAFLTSAALAKEDVTGSY